MPLSIQAPTAKIKCSEPKLSTFCYLESWYKISFGYFRSDGLLQLCELVSHHESHTPEKM